MSEAAARPEIETRGDYLLGLAFILVSTAGFSLGGLFTRLIEADLWSLVFWRGIFCGLTVLVWLIASEGTGGLSRIHRIGWHEVGVILSSSLAMLCYLSALRSTTVANNAVVFGTLPFAVAIIAWLLIGERASAATLLCAAAALLGVVVVMWGSLGGVHLLGDVLSVGMTALNSLMVVLLRRPTAISLMLAVGLSAFAVAAIVAPLASPLAVSGRDLAILALFGATQGAALVLMTVGGRMIPASDAALGNTLSVPLAPFYVWVALGEWPSRGALIGGGIVLAALIVRTLAEGRRRL